MSEEIKLVAALQVVSRFEVTILMLTSKAEQAYSPYSMTSKTQVYLTWH